MSPEYTSLLKLNPLPHEVERRGREAATRCVDTHVRVSAQRVSAVSLRRCVSVCDTGWRVRRVAAPPRLATRRPARALTNSVISRTRRTNSLCALDIRPNRSSTALLLERASERERPRTVPHSDERDPAPRPLPTLPLDPTTAARTCHLIHRT